MSELVRINTRIGSDLNDWLDEYSSKTGMSKSVIMMLAAENFRRENQVMAGMADMAKIVEKLDLLEKAINAADKQ